ncbi:MAG: hypothetical protein WAN04_07255, partial [Candidatus Udaeobacter sp.]
SCVVRITYDFEQCAGKLYQDMLCYCDMTECIEFFKRVDPEVRKIQTYVAGEEDTAYWLKHGGWIATRPRISK